MQLSIFANMTDLGFIIWTRHSNGAKIVISRSAIKGILISDGRVQFFPARNNVAIDRTTIEIEDYKKRLELDGGYYELSVPKDGKLGKLIIPKKNLVISYDFPPFFSFGKEHTIITTDGCIVYNKEITIEEHNQIVAQLFVKK